MTVATFKPARTDPVSKDLLRKDTNPWPTESINNFKSLGCKISREQVEGLRCEMISFRGCGEIGAKASQDT